MDNIRLVFSSCIYCVLVSQVFPAFLTSPINIAQKKALQTTLDCRIDDVSAQIVWKRRPDTSDSSAGWTTLAVGGNALPNFQDRMTIVGATGNFIENNLKIEDLRLDDAHTYQCEDTFAGDSRYAVVIVLEDDPLCTANTSLNNLLEDDVVLLQCDLQYRGAWAPIITWMDNQGNTITATDVTTDTSVRSYWHLTVEKSSAGRSFTARMQFLPPPDKLFPDSWDAADNAPTYSFNSLPLGPIGVHFGANAAVISPVESVYMPGEIISCAGNASPTPRITWPDDKNNNATLATGETARLEMEITEEMEGEQEWICTVTNMIGPEQKESTVQDRIAFTVLVPTTTTTTEPTTDPITRANEPDVEEISGAGLSDAELAFIIIGVLAALIIIAVLFYCVCCRDRSDKEPQKSTFDGVDTIRMPPPMEVQTAHSVKPASITLERQESAPYSPTWPQEGSVFPDGENAPPPYQPYNTYDSNTSVYSHSSGADLAVDDRPRSRRPIQLFQQSQYDV